MAGVRALSSGKSASASIRCEAQAIHLSMYMWSHLVEEGCTLHVARLEVDRVDDLVDGALRCDAGVIKI